MHLLAGLIAILMGLVPQAPSAPAAGSAPGMRTTLTSTTSATQNKGPAPVAQGAARCTTDLLGAKPKKC